MSTAKKVSILSTEYSIIKRSIEEGRELVKGLRGDIEEQQRNIVTLHGQMGDMNEQLNEQKRRCGIFEENFESHKQLMANTLNEYEYNLHNQEVQLKEQEKSLSRLLDIRLKIDFAIDCLILLLSWYFTHHSLPHSIMKFIAFTLFPVNSMKRESEVRKKRIHSVNTCIALIEFLSFILLTKRVRELCLNKGLLSAAGSYGEYAQRVTALIQQGINKLTHLHTYKKEQKEEMSSPISPLANTEASLCSSSLSSLSLSSLYSLYSNNVLPSISSVWEKYIVSTERSGREGENKEEREEKNEGSALHVV